MVNISQIDGSNIAIQDGSFSADNAFIGNDWDGWVNQAYGRKHVSYGNARAWSFTCIEDAALVPWVNSVAKQLYAHVIDGAAVAFAYANGVKYIVPAGQTVYIENIEVWYTAKMAIRYFTVQVKGA